MDLLEKMNDAVDYIEENLTNDIDFEEVARLAYCSEHHFKRIFSFIAGITLSEYIRRRRLTLAALELKNSPLRIIDLAIKYGYSSADSFSRAFQCLHGVTPASAKKNGISLKAYPRMAFHITIKGDAEMNCRFVQKDAFTIVGIKEKVKNDEKGFQPHIWDEINDTIYQELEQLANTDLSGILHVCANVTDENLDYYIAVATTQECPQKYSTLNIPAATWVVFEAVGPDAMLKTWERAYVEWFPTSGYELADAPEFVHSSKHDETKCEIWIPVVKKNI